MQKRPWITRSLAAAVGLLAATACSDGFDIANAQRVDVNFRVTSSAPAAALAPGGPAAVAGPPMTISGTNGTLTITEIRVIVDEVDFKRADGSCGFNDSSGSSDDDYDDDSDDYGDDDCDEFEAGPRFLDLPLDGQPVAALTALVPAGTYTELEFEIEDLEDDDDDSRLLAAIGVVRDEVLAEFPDWPREASALVVGTFTPTGEAAIDFRTYIEAEVEVEIDLNPSLVIDGDGVASRDVTVDVSPEIWFSRPDGTVLPLHLYDYDDTDDLLELEIEMEDGFVEVEFDD